LYSPADVEKLNLLQSAVAMGHSIGRIAGLPLDGLRRLLADAGEQREAAAAPMSGHASFLSACIEAVKLLDERGLERELNRAAVVLGDTALMQRVIAPLLQRIGELWRTGDLRIAQEHLASAVIRSMLGLMRDGADLPGGAPAIVVTTPAGQAHEIGALLVANAARMQGWRVLYLGPNLPAAEIAGAVLESRAKVLALSLIYPPKDPRVSAELVDLRRLAGKEVSVIVGGAAASSYSDVLQEIDAVRLEDLAAFRSELDRIR
jgi:methanogenic corrinoid protein MtbC1